MNDARTDARTDATAGRRPRGAYRGAHRVRRPAWYTRRLRWRRCSLYLEPRDVWIGVYVARQAVYVCPLPMLVIKWERAARGASQQ